MSISELVDAERLSCNMKLSQANRDMLELVKEKEGFPTLNSALSRIIEMYRPFLKRSRRAVHKITKLNKTGTCPVEAEQVQAVKDVFNNVKATGL